METLRYLENTIELPSKGRAYTSEMRLIQGTSVAVTKWTTGHHRDLQAVMKSPDVYKIFHWMLERLLVEPHPRSIDLNKFLMSDVLNIFYICKIFTWGPLADYPYECRCGMANNPVINIGELMEKTADDVTDFSADELVLDIPQHQIKLHLPRLADEKRASEYLKDATRRGVVKDADTDARYYRLCSLIDEIDNKSTKSYDQTFKFLMKQDMSVVDRIEKFLEEQDVGIRMDQSEANCSACSKKSILMLGMTPRFFRPPTLGPDDTGEESAITDVSEFLVGDDGEDAALGVGASV